MTVRLIVNADDLGYTEGVNRGIVEAHRRGIVTSTSLMVDHPAAAHGVELTAEEPRLGIGLHAVVDDVQPERLDVELERQLGRFRYTTERELELATLTDPRVRTTVEEHGLRLVQWGELF